MTGRKRALVIDDDLTFGALMEALLSDDFEVEVLRDGSLAPARAAESKPDVILTDVMMPGVSGLEVLRSLASEPETRHIPVLVLTGSHFNQSNEELFRQEGNVRCFLSKTLPLALILERALEACGGA